MGRRRGTSAANVVGTLALLAIGGALWLGRVAAENWLVLLCIAGVAVVVWAVVRLQSSSTTREAVGAPEARAQPRVEPVQAFTRVEQPPVSQPTKRARWANRGDAIAIGGISFDNGLVYVGEAMPGPDGRQDENCLLRPSLSVARGKPTNEAPSYWPSYTSFTPGMRQRYLRWLADGRTDPAIDIGYVFVFFYGLEYRLFKEGVLADAPILSAEVERLLTIYGGNGSFRRYAGVFLDTVRLLTATDAEPLRLDPTIVDWAGIPLTLRVQLGRRLALGQALDEESGLAWLLALPDTPRRTPLTRCFDVFRALWHTRFAKAFPAGVAIKVPTKELTLRYTAASATFNAEITTQQGSLPDISAATPPKRLRDLFETCVNELDAYSRLIGRRPDAKDSAEAALLLPEAVAASHQGLALARSRLEALLNGATQAAAPLNQILSAVGLPTGESKASSSSLLQAGNILDRLDLGMEPDRRFGTNPADNNDVVVLFRAAKGGAVDPESDIYRSCKALVEICVLAAAADGVVSPEELRGICGDIENNADLTPIEKLRLCAYAGSLIDNPPKLTVLLKRMADRPLAVRSAAARAALSVVLADGAVTAAEVRFLERLHTSLGFDKEALYADLHRADVTVPPAKEETNKQTKRGKNGVAIDSDRLARIQKETQVVSALLADVFLDDIPNAIAVVASAPRPSAVEGLDPQHADFLLTLLDRPDLGRSAAETRARELKLMPDGALETLNDWAFDNFGEALIDDADVVSINAMVRARADALLRTTL